MAYFTYPLVDWRQKTAILTKHLKDEIAPDLLHFLSLLLKKNRFGYFPEVVERFKQKVYEKQGIVEGRLVTPFPVDDETRKKLADKWAILLDKKILMQEAIDKGLIGGGIFMFGDRQIDFSLKGKLQQLRHNLRNHHAFRA